MVLFPLWVEHWSLLIVDFPAKRVEMFEVLKGRKVQEDYKTVLLAYLTEELRARGLQAADFTWKQWASPGSILASDSGTSICAYASSLCLAKPFSTRVAVLALLQAASR